jgi:hypothetical protein
MKRGYCHCFFVPLNLFLEFLQIQFFVFLLSMLLLLTAVDVPSADISALLSIPAVACIITLDIVVFSIAVTTAVVWSPCCCLNLCCRSASLAGLAVACVPAVAGLLDVDDVLLLLNSLLMRECPWGLSGLL